VWFATAHKPAGVPFTQSLVPCGLNGEMAPRGTQKFPSARSFRICFSGVSVANARLSCIFLLQILQLLGLLQLQTAVLPSPTAVGLIRDPAVFNASGTDFPGPTSPSICRRLPTIYSDLNISWEFFQVLLYSVSPFDWYKKTSLEIGLLRFLQNADRPEGATSSM
jgi:hypothetical protein